MARLLKSTGCSSREPRFDSLHPHRGSQLSVTLVPGNLIPSSELCGHQAGMLYTDVHARQTPIHIKSDKLNIPKISCILPRSKYTKTLLGQIWGPETILKALMAHNTGLKTARITFWEVWVAIEITYPSALSQSPSMVLNLSPTCLQYICIFSYEHHKMSKWPQALVVHVEPSASLLPASLR